MNLKRRSLLLYFMALSVPLSAQQTLTLDAAIAEARSNNLQIQAARLGIQEAEALKRTSGEIPKTDISLMHGQYNSYVSTDNNLTITQSIPFPTVWASQHALGKAYVLSADLMRQRIEQEVEYKVASLFYQLLYLDARHTLLAQQDSLYGQLLKAAELRYRTGESALLEKLAAETQWNEVKNQQMQNRANARILNSQLAALLNTRDSLRLVGDFSERLPILVAEDQVDQNPGLRYMRQQAEVAHQQKRVEAARFLPDLTLGYFNQSLTGFQNVNGTEQYYDGNDRFQGFMVGVSLPLWFVPNHARVKAAALQTEKTQKESESYAFLLQAELEGAQRESDKAAQSLTYYTTYALPNAAQLIRQSHVSFQNGEIDYTTHLLNLKNGLAIEEGHLATLHDYQQSVLRINFLTGSLTENK